MEKNRKIFKKYLNTKVFYISALALVAVTALGLFLAFENAATVSAQKESSRGIDADLQAEVLRIALDLRSATEYGVFGQKGISGDGTSSLSVKSGSGSDAALGESGMKVRSDLTKAFTNIGHLPCKEMDTELTGGTFTPGIYCAPSAALAGQMILDAGGDENGIFVFRMAGSMRTSDSFQTITTNGAKASHVFFAAGDTASIGGWSNFDGNIIARNTVDVGAGATVKGRVMSVDSEVILGASSNLVLQTGVLQICKIAGDGLGNRIFRFEVGGVIYEAPANACTGPITLPVGPNVVTELLDGRFTNQPGTWSGRFRLISVTSPTPGAGPTGVNLPLRTATINIREGTIANQTVMNFTNVFAVNAVIEICKRPVAGDPDAAGAIGFFNFTVDALPNQLFPVPMNQCSGAIQVNVPTDPAAPPAPATIRVTELGRLGFNLEAASTFPANRFIALNLGQGIVNNIACSTIGNGPVPPGCVFTNPGGGFVTAQVVEGGTSNQTTINFFNRTAPGVVKICKIAGPGIPEGTRFEFLVQGTVAGPTQPFAPGTVETRTVVVHAGPAAQGGFCDFVRNADGTITQFVVGTNVYVDEIGAIDPVPGVPPGEIRVSRIRLNQSTSGFVAAPATVPGNAAVTPVIPARTVNPNPNLLTGEAVFQVRAETREIEYTNFVFNPTLLKICKIAGPGITQGTSFTFTVAIQNPGGFPFGNQTNQPITVPNVTVQAGPAASGGFCQFAQGPFTPTATTPPIGTFPVGSTVRVCEPAASNAGSTLTGVTSPTGVPTVDLPGRCADLTLGFANGFNELIFTNSETAPVQTGFTISGRVMTPEGGGLRNAQVILTKADGTRLTVPTSSLGFYSFEGLASETYTVGVSSRRYRFQSRSVELNSSLASVDFTGLD